MKKLLIAGVIALIQLTAAQADDIHACHGILTDQRTVGLSLGDCDLNSLSDQDLKVIDDACGQPNGVGDDSNKIECIIMTYVAPNHDTGSPYIVKKFLGTALGYGPEKTCISGGGQITCQPNPRKEIK